MKRVGHRAGAVVAGGLERAVAAAVHVGTAGDHVGRGHDAGDHRGAAGTAAAASRRAAAVVGRGLALEHGAGADAELRARLRPGHAVGREAVAALPALERLLGRGSEGAVHRHPECLLKRLHPAARPGSGELRSGCGVSPRLGLGVGGPMYHRGLQNGAGAEVEGGARLGSGHAVGGQAVGLLPLLERPLRGGAEVAVHADLQGALELRHPSGRPRGAHGRGVAHHGSAGRGPGRRRGVARRGGRGGLRPRRGLRLARGAIRGVGLAASAERRGDGRGRAAR